MAPKHVKNMQAEPVAEKLTTWLGSPISIVVHTIVFIAAFALVLFGVPFDSVLLILTTAVSLEAIYLALFIQMTVNKNTQSLADVEEDIEEIAEDVEGIEKDIDEIEKDIDEMQEDVEEIEKDGDEDDLHDEATMKTLNLLQTDIQRLMKDIQALKDQKK
jgi:low affinity Fe/Cu permease